MRRLDKRQDFVECAATGINACWSNALGKEFAYLGGSEAAPLHFRFFRNAHKPGDLESALARRFNASQRFRYCRLSADDQGHLVVRCLLPPPLSVQAIETFVDDALALCAPQR